MEANQKFFTFGGILNPTPRLSLTVGFDIIKFNNNPMNIGALANFIEKFETKNGLAIEDDPSYNHKTHLLIEIQGFIIIYCLMVYHGQQQLQVLKMIQVLQI